MISKRFQTIFAATFLILSLAPSLTANMNHSPVDLTLYCNPPEIPPGGTLYGEAVVRNNRPQPVSFVMWGGIFMGDELLLEIEPVPGFLYAWDEHLFPIPINIPEEFELGEYRLEINVGPNQEEIWKTDRRQFWVKFPPPIKAFLETSPKTIWPWLDVYANLLLANMIDETLDFSYRGVVLHNDVIVAEIEEEEVILEAGEHTMIPIFIDLPEDLLTGIYNVCLTIGPDSLRWLTVRDYFKVKFPSPIELGLFVNPMKVAPGEMVWASAIVRNETEENKRFVVWGAVTHQEILYLEFSPVHVFLEPGEERLITFPIPIVELSPFGIYRTRVVIGPEVGRDWTAAEALFWVREGDGRKSSRPE